MKTAISMPDLVFSRLSARASELQMSRSELVTQAIEAYLEGLDHASLSRRVDEALALVGPDEDAPTVVAAAKRHLHDLDDQW